MTSTPESLALAELAGDRKSGTVAACLVELAKAKARMHENRAKRDRDLIGRGFRA